jgi:glycerophosphoryl diester phosphodiesterase
MTLGPAAQHSPRAITVAQLCRDAASDVLRRWRTLLLAQAVLKLCALLLLAPMTAAIADVLISFSGSSSVGNTAIAAFIKTVPGMVAVVVLPCLFVATSIFDLAMMLMLIETDGDDRPRSNVWAALAGTLGRVHHLLGVAVAFVSGGTAVILPFVLVGALVYWILLSGTDINYYLDAKPPRFLFAVVIAIALGIAALGACAWLAIRWFFAVPICLLERTGPLESLRVSAVRSCRQSKSIIAAIAAWLLLRFILAGTMLLLLGILNRLALARIHNVTTALWLMAVLLIIDTLAMAIVTALDRIVFAELMSGLYRSSRAGSHEPVAAFERPATQPSHGLLRARGRLVALGLVFSSLVAFATVHAELMASQFGSPQRVFVTAHRAGPLRAPENSLAALRQAIAEGADYAEIDVQLSADGTPFVVHDRDLRRVAGQSTIIAQAHDDELRSADIGSRFSSEFAGERLATLEEFIDAARGHIRLSVELKYYGPDPRLVPCVVQILRDKHSTDQASIISLEYDALRQVRRLDPELRLGYLVAARLGDVTRSDVEFLSVEKRALNRQLQKQAAARGLRIAVWTVNDRDEMVRLLARGAEDLVTDDPAVAIETAKWYRNLDEIELMLLRFRERLSP